MTLIESFSTYGTILKPAKLPELARTDAFRFGASLTIPSGRAIGLKTSDHKAYAFASGASDGTQLMIGFSVYSFKTDAAGLAYIGDQTAVASRIASASQEMPVYIRGVFDPQDVSTAATVTANVVTYTPAGTITTGDVNTITWTRPNGTTKAISFTVAGTTTATAVANGLRAAWNADAELVLLATASGTATFIVTANTAGNDIAGQLAPSVVGVGTLTEANTTAAAGRAIADIVTSRPAAHVGGDGYWYLLD